MPARDGTGPRGFGPGTGRGLGPCGTGRGGDRGGGLGDSRLWGTNQNVTRAVDWENLVARAIDALVNRFLTKRRR